MGINFYIAQGIGLFTAILSIIFVQFKKVKHILLGSIIVNLLSTLNFALLGGMSGAWVCIVAAAQTIVMYFLNKKENIQTAKKWLLCLFSAIYIAGTYLVYKNPCDIISCLCALLYTMSIIQESPGKYRLYTAANAALWIVYDIYTMAFTSILSRALKLAATIAAMIRLDRSPKANEVRKKEGGRNS